MNKQRCSICGAPATICVKETINGVTSENYYCDNCKGLIDSGTSLGDLFNSFFGVGYISTHSGAKTCVCGMTERDVINTGKFGCAECYKTFSNIIGEYMTSRGYLTHKGKSPQMKTNNTSTDRVRMSNEKPISEGDKLTAELQKAINEQRFLDADRIAKQIKALGR